MKVGIISKEAHAKSHAAALEEAGFLPVMLGSNPSEIPTTIPLVVCRTLSCAHGGMDTALAWSRAGGGRLIVENGVKVMLRKALRHRSEVEGERNPGTNDADPVSDPLSDKVGSISYGDLREAVQVLADARPDDTYEVFVEVMQRMYPNEEVSLLRSVVASVRPPAPICFPPEVEPNPPDEPVEPALVEPEAPPTTELALASEVEVTPMPLPPPNTTKKPYPKRFSDHVAESAVDARMEKAWEVRDALTDEQSTAIGKWASKGAVGRVPHGDILRKFDRNPVGFSGLLLLCADKPLALRDISRAYSRVFDKALFARMAEVAAWWLGMELAVATNALPKPKSKTPEPDTSEPDTSEPTEEPSVSVATKPPEATPAPTSSTVPPSTNESTLAVLKALSASLDALIAKVADMDERVGDLTTRIENMAQAPVVTVTNTGTVSTGDALAALAAKGLEVVVRPSSR